MSIINKIVLMWVLAVGPLPAMGKIKVVASTSDIHAITQAVGKEQIELTVLAKGSMDPHYLEAKPSYMVKMRHADLIISNGLSLEVGWLPSLIRGARNPKINPGGRGFLELGSMIEPLERPAGRLSRSMGDVHPEGNPHFTLDPIRVGQAALKIADRLGALDPSNQQLYQSRAREYQKRLTDKVKIWQVRIEKTGIKKVVTYHPSLNYFLARYHLQAAAFLEKKPGIPPTIQHILDVIEIVKKEKIKIILVDNFFDTKIAKRVTKESPETQVKSVGIAVDSAPGLNTIEDVQEQLVRAIEGK